MTLNNMGIHGQEGCSSTNEQQNKCGSSVGNSGVSSQMLEQSPDLLVSMRDLIPILKEVLDMREAEFSDKITQQISDKYDVMIGSMEQRLKDQIAETGQADLKSALMGSVEEAVEDFMRNMLASGGSYERDMRTFVSRIVDERFTGELGSLLGTIDIFSKSKTGTEEAGTGRKSARFSATIRLETYDL